MMHVYKTQAEVLHALADYIVKAAENAIAIRGRFTIALSGGNSPKGLHELLASSAYKSQVEWSKVYFFFGDERYVPADHLDSNALMAKKTLLEPLHIDPLQVFAVNTALTPKEAAADYQKTIEAFFAPGLPVFDLMLLGLGDNSHTASLFPYTDVISATDSGIKEVYLHEQKVFRITMTAPLINQAYHIVFLVFGAAKAEAVHHILNDPEDFDQYPAQLIKPVHGELVWFMDEGAASKITA